MTARLAFGLPLLLLTYYLGSARNARSTLGIVAVILAVTDSLLGFIGEVALGDCVQEWTGVVLAVASLPCCLLRFPTGLLDERAAIPLTAHDDLGTAAHRLQTALGVT